jgi:hypothetical protein
LRIDLMQNYNDKEANPMEYKNDYI